MNHLHLAMMIGLSMVGVALRPSGAEDNAREISQKSDAPVPVVYDDFSDGRWEKRSGKDPWGRALPEWNFGRSQFVVLDASRGYLSARNSPEWKKWKSIGGWIPLRVAYGTWEWKYRFSKGRTVYGNKDCNYFSVNIVCDESDQVYFRGLVSDGHTWFGRTGNDKDDPAIRHNGKEVQLLHDRKGGWGIGLFVDDRWHVCRITRDREKGFTIYHDNRIVSSGWRRGDPKDNGTNGLFRDVKDDTYKTCERFALSMRPAVGWATIDVDDITIYEAVLPAPRSTPLRELCAIAQGEDVSELPRLVNYASAEQGAVASSDTKESTPGQDARHMIDGITTDYDGGNGYGYAKWPDYLTVQLREVRPIDEIYVALWDFPVLQVTRKFPGPRKYDLEVDISPDGTHWTSVAGRQQVTQIQRIELGATGGQQREVRYIRMRGKCYAEYQHGKYPSPPEIVKVIDELHVVEVEAYACSQHARARPADRKTKKR